MTDVMGLHASFCQLLMTKVTSLCLSGGILIVGGKPPTLDISISGPAVGTAG